MVNVKLHLRGDTAFYVNNTNKTASIPDPVFVIVWRIPKKTGSIPGCELLSVFDVPLKSPDL